MATIRDIAKYTGFSTATVSRVLNNHPSVNEATRLAVLEAVEALDYSINNLRSNNNTIRNVLILSRDDNNQRSTKISEMRHFERGVWNAAHTVLETQNIATRLQQSHMLPEEARQFAADLTLSGVILLGGALNPDFVKALQHHNIPFVIAGAMVHDIQADTVMLDIMQGITLACNHLIEQGRQLLALVNGPDSTITSHEKYNAFRLSLALQNLPFQSSQVVKSDFSAESGYQQTLQLLEQNPDLDAILFADDSIALGGMRAIKESGRQIPRDIAVVGFGDYDICEYTDPPLTSVHVDTHALGVIAAKRLLSIVETPEEYPWVIRIPATLTVRYST